MSQLKPQKSLYGKLLAMTLTPLLVLAVVITSFSAHSFANTMNEEVKKGLMDLNSTILTLYDHLYPGDYTVVEQDGALYLLKGEHQINGDFSIIDTIKKNTGVDVTFFYRDIRVITTLTGSDGNRMIGTKVNAVVTRDVLETGEAAFYPSVAIGENNYFAYYAPVINSDGSVMGMLFVAKPTEEVYKSVIKSVLPIVLLGLVAMLLAAVITIRFSRQLIDAIKKIQSFLAKVAKGNLRDVLDYDVAKRNDELGEMGRYAVTMQKALIEQVEKDALTGLYNRRYAEKKIREVQNAQLDEFNVALGDIDFFKKVNDTYGHECGDVVLSRVAGILGKNMRGKGFVARWGGEEFLLVFENSVFEDSVDMLTHILEEIRREEIFYKGKIVRITMIFGICKGNTDNVDLLIREADSKLYEGKNNGRNQIVQ